MRFPSQEELIQEDPNKHHLYDHKAPPEPFDFFTTFYSQNFLQPPATHLDSYPSYNTANNFAYTFPLPSHLTHHYDDPRGRSASIQSLPTVHGLSRSRSSGSASKFRRRRRKRRTRSANVDYKGSGAESGDNLNESSDDITSKHSLAVENNAHKHSHSRDSVISGLPVHFPSLSATASRSFDDIFALVAEDDLLSEESFDRLIKLTEDKISDTTEEDYSSGTETVVSSSSSSSSSSAASSAAAAASSSSSSSSSSAAVIGGSGSSASELQDTNHQQQNVIEDFERLQQNEDPTPTRNNADDSSKRTQPVQDQEPEAEAESESVSAQDPEPETEHDSDLESQHMQTDRELESKPNDNDNIETLYNAHLVSNDNEKIVSVTEDDVEQRSTQDTTEASKLLDSVRKVHRSILDSDFPLTRLNPWISACDLAQPGPLSAPDLQVS